MKILLALSAILLPSLLQPALWVSSNPGPSIDMPMSITRDASSVYWGGMSLNGTYTGRIEKRNLSDAVLDASFGSGGVISLSGIGLGAQVIQLLQNGAYLFASVNDVTNTTRTRIMKFNAGTGALDAGFGVGGVLDYATLNGDRPGRMVLDGAYLWLVGYSGASGNTSAIIEKRLQSSGALVAAFGASGQLANDLTSNDDRYVDLVADAGYIYVSGTYNALSWTASANNAFVEKRSGTDGSLIPAFGISGRVNGSQTGWNRISAQADGYITMLGPEINGGNTQASLQRLNKANGSVLASFAGSGIFIDNPGAFNTSMLSTLIDSGYAYLVGMRSLPASDAAWRVVKVDLSNGTLDASFQSGGSWELNPSAYAELASQAVLDGSKLYITGAEYSAFPDGVWRIEQLSVGPPPSPTPSFTPSPIYSPTGSPTASPALSPTLSPSATPTRTPSSVFSPTPSATAASGTLPEAVDNLGISFTLGGNANWYYQTSTAFSGGDAAQSGDIFDSQSTWMQSTFNGPGTLSFYWSVSSESGWDYLRLMLDGVDQGSAISGSVGWTLRSLAIPSGAHTVRWTYSKDSSISTGADAGWVDQVVFVATTLTPSNTFTPSPTFSVSSTISPTHSISPTRSTSPTFTVSPTISNTRTASPSPTLLPTAVVAGFPYYTGFESGSLGPEWVPVTGGAGLIQVTTANVPFAGSYHLNLHGTGAGYGLSQIDLHINLTGQTVAYLSFAIHSYSEDNNALPASFSGSYNGDGVAISQDGINWYTLYTGFPNFGDIPYNVQTFNLITAMSAAGFTNFNDIRIRFQQYDNFAIPTDGFGIDEVFVTASAPTATHTPTTTRTLTVSPTRTSSPTPVPNNLPEAVDNLGLIFTTGGSAVWLFETGFTLSGGDSAISGNIGDSQSTWMETSVTGPGTLSFYWAISSEASFDYLNVAIDGTNQGGGISGNVSWTIRTLSIAAGTHTVRWTYSKDGSISSGSDAAWVDWVQWAPSGSSPTRTATRSSTPSPTPTRTATGSPSATVTRSVTPYQSPTASPTGPALAAVRHGKIFSYPNPFLAGKRNLTFRFDPAPAVEILIYDWAGSAVASVSQVYAAQGYAIWDGKNAQGQIVAPGVYFGLLRQPTGDRMCKFTVAW